MELETKNSRLINKINKLKNTTMVKSIFKRDTEEATNQLIIILYIIELKNQYLKKNIQK
jgi:hypothetical protein